MEKESELLRYNAKMFIESFTKENNSLELLFPSYETGKHQLCQFGSNLNN